MDQLTAMTTTRRVTQMDAGELRQHLAYRLATGCGWDERRRLARILMHRTGLTYEEVLDTAYQDAEAMLVS